MQYHEYQHQPSVKSIYSFFGKQGKLKVKIYKKRIHAIVKRIIIHIKKVISVFVSYGEVVCTSQGSKTFPVKLW